ncbi:MAG: hypothetical protein AAFX99_28880, partial [Myxococcota bacterium]
AVCCTAVNTTVACAADSESVTCLGDGGEEARNVCGGCTPINAAPGDPCGRCDSGTLACADDNEELECVGDQGDAAENACGGCAELDGLPGDACGVCGVYVCAEGDNDQVACMPGGLELCDEEGGHLGHDDDCDEMIDEGCP